MQMNNRSYSIQNMQDYKNVYQKSTDDPEAFWADIADDFIWRKKWDKVLQWEFRTPDVQWFLNGKFNITENCLDRYVALHPDKPAIIWEPNGTTETGVTFTYRQLHEAVCKFSNVLRNNGAAKGDRICIYMPMIPELAIAVLACARIGAIHSVVFAGFSANALAGRINDAQCKLVITSDGSFRGNKTIAIKNIVDEALLQCNSVQKVIVKARTGADINWNQQRDIWWHDEMQKADAECEPEVMDAGDTLFILYTSGSTGKPKGVVHSCAGYMVYAAYTFRTVFQYRPDDIYWCTADAGWITGHSYIIYGPLLNGATTIMFEGIPTYPDAGRFWKVIDKYGVNIFYTAPTAIRSLMAYGDEYVLPYSLRTLRTLGSVGEPINEEAWHWYAEKIGKNNCNVVDTWWQTETGGILISPIAGITPEIPGYATMSLPGIQPAIVDEQGNEITDRIAEGSLCFKFPWPGMLRTTYGDHERCRLTYFSHFPGFYESGDTAKRDADGNYRIRGRADDVMKVSGHRIDTAEVENAINAHEEVLESAVVPYPHEIKGNAIYAFVICRHEIKDVPQFTQQIKDIVAKEIGAIAKPDKIQIVTGLPKTRSGKIMRRILRKIAEGDTENIGDISTLLDPSVVAEIKKNAV